MSDKVGEPNKGPRVQKGKGEPASLKTLPGPPILNSATSKLTDKVNKGLAKRGIGTKANGEHKKIFRGGGEKAKQTISRGGGERPTNNLEKYAAKKIQATFKTYNREKKAATKLQATFRGHVARQEVSTKKIDFSQQLETAKKEFETCYDKLKSASPPATVEWKSLSKSLQTIETVFTAYSETKDDSEKTALEHSLKKLATMHSILKVTLGEVGPKDFQKNLKESGIDPEKPEWSHLDKKKEPNIFNASGRETCLTQYHQNLRKASVIHKNTTCGNAFFNAVMALSFDSKNTANATAHFQSIVTTAASPAEAGAAQTDDKNPIKGPPVNLVINAEQEAKAAKAATTATSPEEEAAAALKEKAATTIQKAARGKLGRTAAKEAKAATTATSPEQDAAAAITLQSAVRSKKARNTLNVLKKEKAAKAKVAILIQSRFRGKQGRTAATEAKAAITLQSAVRSKKARNTLNVLKKEKAAKAKVAILIQSRFRGKQVRTELANRKTAATEAQAAITIQKAARGKQGRQEFKRKKDAALKIQNAYRGKQGRKEQGRQAAAITLQSAVRSKKARGELANRQKAALQEQQAAITIQKAARGMKGRKAFTKQREEQQAATAIQRVYRGFQGRTAATEAKAAATEAKAAAAAMTKRFKDCHTLDDLIKATEQTSNLNQNIGIGTEGLNALEKFGLDLFEYSTVPEINSAALTRKNEITAVNNEAIAEIKDAISIELGAWGLDNMDDELKTLDSIDAVIDFQLKVFKHLTSGEKIAKLATELANDSSFNDNYIKKKEEHSNKLLQKKLADQQTLEEQKFAMRLQNRKNRKIKKGEGELAQEKEIRRGHGEKPTKKEIDFAIAVQALAKENFKSKYTDVLRSKLSNQTQKDSLESMIKQMPTTIEVWNSKQYEIIDELVTQAQTDKANVIKKFSDDEKNRDQELKRLKSKQADKTSARTANRKTQKPAPTNTQHTSRMSQKNAFIRANVRTLTPITMQVHLATRTNTDSNVTLANIPKDSRDIQTSIEKSLLLIETHVKNKVTGSSEQIKKIATTALDAIITSKDSHTDGDPNLERINEIVDRAIILSTLIPYAQQVKINTIKLQLIKALPTIKDVSLRNTLELDSFMDFCYSVDFCINSNDFTNEKRPLLTVKNNFQQLEKGLKQTLETHLPNDPEMKDDIVNLLLKHIIFTYKEGNKVSSKKVEEKDTTQTKTFAAKNKESFDIITTLYRSFTKADPPLPPLVKKNLITKILSNNPECSVEDLPGLAKAKHKGFLNKFDTAVAKFIETKGKTFDLKDKTSINNLKAKIKAAYFTSHNDKMREVFEREFATVFK
jgi:hypothetical protein